MSIGSGGFFEIEGLAVRGFSTGGTSGAADTDADSSTVGAVAVTTGGVGIIEAGSAALASTACVDGFATPAAAI